MTATLRISPDLALPTEAVTQTFAVLAKRGAGKTYAALVFVEELLKAHLQVVVADPIGVCWGLRATADGRGPGLPIVVLGGDHGDVPLEPTGGTVIADLVVDEGIPAVLDLSLLRKGEQVRFMTDFAERLYHRNRRPLHLVLDEADAFAPQRPMPGQQRMLGAVEDLVRRGRARGIGVTLVTQRAAVLNKDVLTQVEVLVALRTIAPQDRGAIDEWIKVHGTPEQRDQLMASLPSLPIGAAWFWSPGWLDLFQRVQVRKRETFDSSATPKVGQKLLPPKTLADVDLEALRKKLATTIERAKAEDPKHLQARIRELERELARRPTETKVETVVERVEVPVLGASLADEFRTLVAALSEQAQQLTVLGTRIADALGRAATPTVGSAAHAEKPSPEPRSKLTAAQRERARADKTLARIPVIRDPAISAALRALEDPPLLKAGARRMLQVLASHHQLRVTRAQLATLARMRVTGGTFTTYFSTLKRAGYVMEEGRQVHITPAGMAYLGADVPPPPQTTEELLEQWGQALKRGARDMLQVLVDRYPRAITREQLAEAIDMEVTGGTFGTYLSTLRRNGLAEVDSDQVRASSTLFLALGAGGA